MPTSRSTTSPDANRQIRRPREADPIERLVARPSGRLPTEKVQNALPVPYHRGGPQVGFNLTSTTVEGNTAASSMILGPWARSDLHGGLHQGSVGVLIDDVTAYAALSARAEDQWGVSASINVAFHVPIPDSAETLQCTATVDHRTRRWAHASGDVLTNTGELVATVGQRFRYIPGSSAVHQRPGVPAHSSSWLESIDELLEAPKQSANDEVELRVRPHQGMLNPLGIFHGGISLCLSELAARMAWETSPGEPTEALHTSSIHISYLRPGLPSGTPVIYVKFLHFSRSVILAEVTLRNSTGEIATHAVITLHRSHTTS